MQTRSQPKNRIFMYGGCVSRDTYDFLDRAEHQLLHYVSRQSVISAFSDLDTGLLAELDMRPFQRRNAEGDFRGDLIDRIEPFSDLIDTFVWDILIDRNGVIRTTDGRYVTYSYDLQSAGVFDRMREIGMFQERIHFGTDEHFFLWTASVDRFLSYLDSKGIADKLLLIIAPWANVMDNGGTPTHWAQGPTPDQANSLYPRYYDYLTNTKGVRSVTIPEEAVMTRHDHKWGPAPYHYVDAAYKHIREALLHDPALYAPKYSA